MQLLPLVALFVSHCNPLIDCFIKKNLCVSDIKLNVTCEAESDNYYGVTYFVSSYLWSDMKQKQYNKRQFYFMLATLF